MNARSALSGAQAHLPAPQTDSEAPRIHLLAALALLVNGGDGLLLKISASGPTQIRYARGD